MRAAVALVLAVAGVVVAGAVAGGPFAAGLLTSQARPAHDKPPHGGGDPSSQHTQSSDTPEAPPAPETPATPVDPLGSCGTGLALVITPVNDVPSAAQMPAAATACTDPSDADARAHKTAAAAAARAQFAQVEDTVFAICMLFTALAGDPDVKGKVIIALGTFCALGILELASLQHTADDPPAANVLEVALPTPSTASRAFQCTKQLSALRCTSLKGAFTRLQAAMAKLGTASTGMALTMDRLSGALRAGSADGRAIQTGAEKAYAGQVAAALTAQATAGRALAALLRANKLDVRFSAGDKQKLLARLGSPRKIPASIVSTLVASGLATGAPEVSKKLWSIFAAAAAPPTLSSALATPVSTTALVQLSKTLTINETAALVRALAAQNAITDGTRNALLDDLRDALTAESSGEHTAALGRFDLDAGEVSGPAGTLLAAAAQAL